MNNLPLPSESFPAVFKAAEELMPLMGQVETDNVRFVTANESLADSPLLPVVQGAISVEQAAHWTAMVESGKQIPYEAIASTDEAVHTEITTLKTALSDPALPTPQEVTALEQEHVIALKLAPNSVEEINKLVYEVQAKPTWLKRRELEARLDDAHSARLALDGLYDVIGAPWPIPQSFETNPNVDDNQDPDGDFEMIEDIVPVEPSIHDKAQCIRAGVERSMDNPQASDYLKRYLTENVGRIVTVDELAQYLYSPEQINNVNPRYLRSRITSPLGEVHGQPIREDLLDQGMTLQYGWRKRSVWSAGTRSWTHDRPKRIYRLMPTDTLTPQDYDGVTSRTEGGRVEDRWESSTTVTASTIVHAPTEQRNPHHEISQTSLTYVQAIAAALKRKNNNTNTPPHTHLLSGASGRSR